MTFGNDTARAWMEYGRSHAKHKSLWDGSLAFATIGPQPIHPTKAIDFSGRNNHGTLTNGPTWEQSSLRGQAFSSVRFDGSDDSISIVNGFANSISQLDKHAISVWIKPTILGYATFIHVPGTVYKLQLYTTNGMYWRCGANYRTYSLKLKLNQWNSIICVKTDVGDSGDLYLNGSRQVSFYGSLGNTPSVADLSIGGTEYYFNGSIAAVGIHRRILTPNEIATLATHPLEAYRVEVPRYYFFGTTAATHLWPWQIRRMRRTAGAR